MVEGALLFVFNHQCERKSGFVMFFKQQNKDSHLPQGQSEMVFIKEGIFRVTQTWGIFVINRGLG